jgi:hypothetical protein
MEINFRFHRSAIVSGSFDSVDSPLRGESAALRMTETATVKFNYVCACGLWAGFCFGGGGALITLTSKSTGNCFGGKQAALSQA